MRRLLGHTRGWLPLAIVLCLHLPASADEVDASLAAIAQVGPQGQGSPAAQRARDHLLAQGSQILPRLVVALDTDNPVAANWYRVIYEQLLAEELAKPSPRLPLEEMRAIVADPARQRRLRRLLLKTLDQIEPEFGKALIPTLLDDPEFRGDAVALALAAGAAAQASGEKEAALAAYRRAFDHARDSAQVTQAAAQLGTLGETVDVTAHLGYVVDWIMLGPFEAAEYTGFAKVFPPEEKLDLKAEYTGLGGRKLAWKEFRSPDPLGQLNLMEAVAPVKEAVAYAYAELDSPQDQSGELRCGADDNLTVWLNGEKILAREQWLNGTRPDRFIAPAKLIAGRNRVLVKICQGPQHKDPDVPNNWSLQLRFCDATGIGLGLKPLLPAATAPAETAQP